MKTCASPWTKAGTNVSPSTLTAAWQYGGGALLCAVFQLTGVVSPPPVKAVSVLMAVDQPLLGQVALPTALRPVTNWSAAIQPSMATSS